MAGVAAVLLAGWLLVQWVYVPGYEEFVDEAPVDTKIHDPAAEEIAYEDKETLEEPPRGPRFASDYYEHDHGGFLLEDNEWVEYSWDPNAASFTFEETGRDREWIYLHDASRNLDIALPMGEGYMMVREPADTDWRELYYLTPQ